jgi:hypothetical protein
MIGSDLGNLRAEICSELVFMALAHHLIKSYYYDVLLLDLFYQIIYCSPPLQKQMHFYSIYESNVQNK